MLQLDYDFQSRSVTSIGILKAWYDNPSLELQPRKKGETSTRTPHNTSLKENFCL